MTNLTETKSTILKEIPPDSTLLTPASIDQLTQKISIISQNIQEKQVLQQVLNLITELEKKGTQKDPQYTLSKRINGGKIDQVFTSAKEIKLLINQKLS